MSVTHFDPYFLSEGIDYEYKTACGVLYSEFDPKGTGNWDKVSCKRCLKMKDKLKVGYESDEKYIIEQMGDMTNFMEKLNIV